VGKLEKRVPKPDEGIRLVLTVTQCWSRRTGGKSSLEKGVELRILQESGNPLGQGRIRGPDHKTQSRWSSVCEGEAGLGEKTRDLSGKRAEKKQGWERQISREGGGGADIFRWTRVFFI